MEEPIKLETVGDRKELVRINTSKMTRILEKYIKKIYKQHIINNLHLKKIIFYHISSITDSLKIAYYERQDWFSFKWEKNRCSN